ncbi:asparaginase [Paenibacillus sp. GCM10023252]|uniref:asparaginase n=1 Tax=Paenibacillus sp. GCM10023252 TaxID=3252649 RepID=UPI0036126CA5
MDHILTVVKRGQTIESVHQGHIAIVDSSGQLLYAAGNPSHRTFARSALKPLQAFPLITSGAAEHFLLNDKELAICCGSHNGEDMHVQTVRSILYRLGLEEGGLQCGAHLPYDESSSHELLRRGVQPGAAHNNCSGKHAGMLALALNLHSDIERYHEQEHPVQRLIASALGEMTGMTEGDWEVGIDGCGVPTYSFPLDKLALLYARFAEPSRLPKGRHQQAARQIAKAMTSYPEMVAGTNILDTDLMRMTGGDIIAKGGAEGVYAMGIVSRGIGIAIKVDDGNLRAAYPAAVEILSQLNLIDADMKSQLDSYWHPVIRNRRGEAVGAIEPVLRLTAAQRDMLG